MVDAERPFYLKFSAKMIHPLHGDFQSIFARSTSSVTPSEKGLISLIGSQLRAF